MFPRGVPDKWTSVESKTGDAVAETLDCSGRGRTKRGAQLPEFCACVRRQRREVGSHVRLSVANVIAGRHVVLRFRVAT
jgi:hypothetical protein